MKLPVIWTPEAESSFQEQINILEADWPEPTFRKFIDRVFDTIDRISMQPEMYRAYENSGNIRVCVINRNISLYYKIKESQIDLLFFWPNRNDPEKFPL